MKKAAFSLGLSIVWLMSACVDDAGAPSDQPDPMMMPTGGATNPPPILLFGGEPVGGAETGGATAGGDPGDTGGSDANRGGETAGPNGGESATGYMRCNSPDDCLQGYCVPSPDGSRVCSERCGRDSDCPTGWVCAPIANTRPDTVFICVADRKAQCLACAQDSDCGAGLDRCIQIGTNLRCAQDCSLVECPQDSTCSDVDIDGETVPLCLPDNGQCAPCEDADGDGYGNIGDCLGLDCDDSDPQVYQGADELCDEKDNDCDDRTDEVQECAPCMDEDGDGYGLAGNCMGFDCNDDNATVYPGATEVCDDLDNDCDSKTDEGVVAPIEADCKMEGVCAGTQPECQDGEWTCTYPETYQADAESTCDNLDNDCDGGLDEDFNFEGDPNNCGGCGIICMVPRAAAACVQFQCLVGACQEGWHDIDMDPSNGCEYACVASAGGEEICDGEDNDCDGQIDEGFGDVEDLPDADGLDSNCDGIDGTVSTSLFVALDGSDDNSGLTPDQPLATLAQAFQLRFVWPERTEILIESGLYSVAETIRLPETSAGVYSGYGAGFTVRNGQRAIIDIDAPIGLIAENLVAAVTIEGVDFRISDQQADGEASVGLVIADSGEFLTLTNSSLRAGRGGPGRSGTDGFDGTTGSDGSPGAGANGGEGGAVGGGLGARGRRRARGLSGASGLPQGCGGAGGSGGSSGLGCNDGDAGPGGRGQNGCVGSNGRDGTPGSNIGSLAADLSWRAANGTDGTDGSSGGGGGGGGAGVGEDCRPVNSCEGWLGGSCGTGRGGGGGGGAGGGGTKGTAGTSGGASIGIIAKNSNINLIKSEIRTVGGGNGGRGGAFGRGGNGGSGGTGQGGDGDSKGDGGDGGNGGSGGRGGCGGAGGGGPSIGLWGVGMAAIRLQDGSSITTGLGGDAGRSCDGANGADGVRSNLRDAQEVE